MNINSENNNIWNSYVCSVEHFLQDEYSICREERQYAVFLYNILRKYRSKDKRNGNQRIINIFDVPQTQTYIQETKASFSPFHYKLLQYPV